MNKEQVYDEHIAPLLLEAGKVAMEHEIDLLAAVDISNEEDPYAITETRCIDLDTAHCGMRLIQEAILAKGNVDAMMMSIIRDQKGKKHNSIVISMLDSFKSM